MDVLLEQMFQSEIRPDDTGPEPSKHTQPEDSKRRLTLETI